MFLLLDTSCRSTFPFILQESVMNKSCFDSERPRSTQAAKTDSRLPQNERRNNFRVAVANDIEAGTSAKLCCT